MSYTLKHILYHDEPREILLQNENGPCPLLAAANVLLLRGVIQLSNTCIADGAASIDDVVNILAEWAMKLSGSVNPSNNEEESSVTSNNSSLEHKISELLLVFSSLQFGIDINPKLASGPTGVEYTKNLTTFDLMDIELVHGWLVDPNDVKTSSVIGNKTYYELIEAIVIGAEASNEMERLEKLIKTSIARVQVLEGTDQPTGKCAFLQGGKCVNVSSLSEEDNCVESVPSKITYTEEKHDVDIFAVAGKYVKTSLDSDQELDSRSSLGAADSEHISLVSKINDLKKNWDEQNLLYTNGCIINSFFTETSNRLTYPGLTELYKYVQEGSICIFFRKNHFSTLTKDGGVLYLLVTDLGYANVSEVVWEKVDDVTGDTEYTDEYFANLKPKDQSEDIYYQLAALLNQKKITADTQGKQLPRTSIGASILERNSSIDTAHVEEVSEKKKFSSRKRKQPWTGAEEEALELAVMGDKQQCLSDNELFEEDWDEIANFVPGRTPVECFKRYAKTTRNSSAHW